VSLYDKLWFAIGCLVGVVIGMGAGLWMGSRSSSGSAGSRQVRWDSSSFCYSRPVLRKVHLVRPDLLFYPMQVAVYA
jgi:hypothetical protein